MCTFCVTAQSGECLSSEAGREKAWGTSGADKSSGTREPPAAEGQGEREVRASPSAARGPLPALQQPPGQTRLQGSGGKKVCNLHAFQSSLFLILFPKRSKAIVNALRDFRDNTGWQSNASKINLIFAARIYSKATVCS